jgi:hypothetical protein
MDARRDTWVWGWRLCRAIGLVLLLGAACVAMNWIQMPEHKEALLPAGLFFCFLSTVW